MGSAVQAGLTDPLLAHTLISMKKPILILLLSLLLFSCANSKTIILWSDREEMADAVELYNRSGAENRVIFQYREDLVSSFFTEEKQPDIIIGGNLLNGTVKERLTDLTILLKTETDERDFLSSPLFSGTEGEDFQPLIPLAYSPLIVAYQKNSKRIAREGINLEIDEIRNLGISFNEEKRRGFSPFWDEDVLMAFLDLNGTGFSSSTENFLQWNREQLLSSTAYLKEWTELNGGRDKMDAFDSKYMYDNPLKLLKEDRILFCSYDLERFMKLSDAINRTLDFSYISHEGRIHPGTVIYGGVNRENRSKEQSLHFMAWLLAKENQEAIISSAIKNGTGNSGFLGGLSTFDRVNREILTKYYPGLSGKIPFSSYLFADTEKPVEYNKVKKELIVPWLREDRLENPETLETALDKWRKLRIPF